MDIQEWNFPKMITNPHIEKDIHKYLGEEGFQKYRDQESSRDILTRIVDMMEYIDHLKFLSQYLKRLDKPTKEERSNGVVILSSHIVFEEHDFSGFQWDTEALIFYMYVSIMDACINPSEYVSAADYVKKNCADDQQLSKVDAIHMMEEYHERFGLSRNFKSALQERLSDDLKQRIVNNIMVIKNFSLEQKDWNQIFEKWTSKTQEEKLRKIADAIYNMRSKYTHANIRNFLPNDGGYQIIKKESIVSSKGIDFESILREIVIELALTI